MQIKETDVYIEVFPIIRKKISKAPGKLLCM